MLYWAIVFLLVAAVSAPFGFGGVAPVSAGPAQSLFFVFLALFVIALVASVVLRTTPKVTRLGNRPSVSRRS